MTDYQQNPVSQATWPWAAPPVAPKVSPAAHGRKKVIITTPIALAIAYSVHRFLGHTIMAYVITSIALFIAFSAFVLPSVFAAIDRFFLRLGHYIGVTVTWLLLVPFFFIFFVPGHALFALFGKDPMARRRLPGDQSGWHQHPGITRTEHFKRQH